MTYLKAKNDRHKKQAGNFGMLGISGFHKGQRCLLSIFHQPVATTALKPPPSKTRRREIEIYLRRRFLPAGESFDLLLEHSVVVG